MVPDEGIMEVSDFLVESGSRSSSDRQRSRCANGGQLGQLSGIRWLVRLDLGSPTRLLQWSPLQRVPPMQNMCLDQFLDLLCFFFFKSFQNLVVFLDRLTNAVRHS